jgi:hypothetical protein
MPRHVRTAARASTPPPYHLPPHLQVDESVLQMRRKLAALDAGARRASREEAQRRTDALESSRRMGRVCMVVDFDMFYAAVGCDPLCYRMQPPVLELRPDVPGCAPYTAYAPCAPG